MKEKKKEEKKTKKKEKKKEEKKERKKRVNSCCGVSVRDSIGRQSRLVWTTHCSCHIVRICSRRAETEEEEKKIQRMKPEER